MGLETKKYHVTDEGVVYRVDDTGEITELGNVESLSGPGAADAPPSAATDANVRYSMAEMEGMIVKGAGKGLNRYERRMVAKECRNVEALECFVEFAGSQWINMLVGRFERGETWLEPVLEKAAGSPGGSCERLAGCKRKFSKPGIYHVLHAHDNPNVNDALKANPNSPYYEAGFVPKPKGGGGCLGVVAFLVAAAGAVAMVAG